MHSVDEFLQHYESQPYDPVKAHEYYMQNRQLKGRKTSGMSDQQKEAWAYTKDQITTEKTAKIKAEEELKQKKIEEVQKRAAETRSRISEKLKAYAAQISNQTSADRDKIAADRQAKIDSLPPIPKGLSAEKRAVEAEKRKKEIAAIRGEASEDIAGVTNESKTERAGASADAAGEREQTKTELKTVIQSAKEAFTATKEQLVAGYETTYQTEYDKIMATVPGKVKKSSSKKSSGKKKGGYYIWRGEKK